MSTSTAQSVTFPVVDDTGECQCAGHRDLRTFDAS